MYSTTADPTKSDSNHWSNGENKEIDLSKLSDIEINGIDTNDYPDFCDAFLSYASYNDEGFERPLTDSECESITENCADFIHEQVLMQLF